MNSVLSYIAGFFVLLLFAALVGPSIVDWNSFRAEIESQISETVGRPVSIGGDINFVILPAPRFSLQELAIGDSDAELPLARIGRLEGEVALAPLLRAEIDVVGVRALDFTVNITRDENGKFNWSNGAASDLGVTIDPQQVSLDSMLFENGEVLYRSASSQEAVRLSNLAGELTATSLVGPLKFDGTFEYQTAAYELSVGIGAFGGDRAFPVNIDLGAPDHQWKASFSGLSTEATTSARLDGAFEFRLGELEVEGETSPFLRVTAGLVGNGDVMSFREVELSVADASLKGQMEIALGSKPVVTASFSGARLAVDQFWQDLEAAALPVEEVRLPSVLSGEIDLSIADLSFHDAHISNGHADVRLVDGELLIDSLSAELPGDTTAEIKGTFGLGQGVPRFDGSLETTIGNAGAFARWLESVFRSTPVVNAVNGIQGRDSGPLRIQSELALQPSLFQAYSLSVFSGEEEDEAHAATGGLSFANRGRPAMSIELRGPAFDLSWLEGILEFDAFYSTLNFSSFDANVILGFDTLTLPDAVLTKVDLAASLAEGVLTVDTFTSTLNGRDEISAVGTVSDIGPFATGGFEGKINAAFAASLGGLLLDTDLPQFDGGILSYVLRGEQTETGHIASLDVSGELNGSSTSLVVSQRRVEGTPSADKVDIAFALENPDAQVMLDLLGIEPSATVEGPGRFRLQLSGQPASSLDTSVRFGVGDVSGSITGKTETPFVTPRFDGRFEASAPTFGTVSQAVGWRGGLADLISANARDGAFVAGGGLAWSSDRIALSEFEGIAGAFRMSGGGALTHDEPLPTIEVSVSFGSVVLDPIFSAEGDDLWSAEPLDWTSLAKAKGSFAFTASKVSVANMVVEDLAATGTLADGVLSFTPVTAEVAGGRLTMGARVEGGEGVPGLGLTFAVEDVVVDDVSQMLFGTNLAGGEGTASLQLEGRGRSLLGMVSSLSGKGTLTLAEGQLNGFDLTGFRAAIDGLSSMDDFNGDAASKLETGSTVYNQIDGTVVVEEGILRFAPEQVEVSGGDTIKIGAMADLVRLEADVETKLTLPGVKPLPPLTMLLAGPLRALERRNDTLAIQQAVSQALLVRDIEEAGIEDLPDELRDLIIVPDSSSELDAPLEGVIETSPSSAPTPVERPTN